MGAVADAALQYESAIIGVIPQSLVAREISHTKLTHPHVDANMQERKNENGEELADAFYRATWRGRDAGRDFRAVDVGSARASYQALYLFGSNGFCRQLQDMIRQMVSKGVLKRAMKICLFSKIFSEIIEYFIDYRAPDVKWSKRTWRMKVIHIAAAVITDQLGRVLLVGEETEYGFYAAVG